MPPRASPVSAVGSPSASRTADSRAAHRGRQRRRSRATHRAPEPRGTGSWPTPPPPPTTLSPRLCPGTVEHSQIQGGPLLRSHHAVRGWIGHSPQMQEPHHDAILLRHNDRVPAVLDQGLTKVPCDRFPVRDPVPLRIDRDMMSSRRPVDVRQGPHVVTTGRPKKHGQGHLTILALPQRRVRTPQGTPTRPPQRPNTPSGCRSPPRWPCSGYARTTVIWSAASPPRCHPP